MRKTPGARVCAKARGAFPVDRATGIAKLSRQCYRRRGAQKRNAKLPPTGPQAADEFDTECLAADAMAKSGKEPSDAESHDAAMPWVRKAADLGSTEA